MHFIHTQTRVHTHTHVLSVAIWTPFGSSLPMTDRFLTREAWSVCPPGLYINHQHTTHAHTHTNTQACLLTPIFIHTSTHVSSTHTYVVSLCSLQTFSVPFPRLDQFVHCSGSVWQSPGDGLGLALLLCSYEAVLSNTEGMSAAPLFNKAQYEPV